MQTSEYNGYEEGAAAMYFSPNTSLANIITPCADSRNEKRSRDVISARPFFSCLSLFPEKGTMKSGN